LGLILNEAEDLKLQHLSETTITRDLIFKNAGTTVLDVSFAAFQLVVTCLGNMHSLMHLLQHCQNAVSIISTARHLPALWVPSLGSIQRLRSCRA